jgi:hypothetical protein
MRLKEKILILAASVLLSLAAFSLIAGPSVDMVKMGRKAGYEMIVNYLANPANPDSASSGH